MRIRFSRTAIAFGGFFLVAGYFLWTEHAAHIELALPYLPYVLLMLCPLLHLFMHGGHGHGHHNPSSEQERNNDLGRRRSTQVADEARPGSTNIPQTGGRHD